jgi:hypothetical protein
MIQELFPSESEILGMKTESGLAPVKFERVGFAMTCLCFRPSSLDVTSRLVK